jgi:hypothetical protein
VFVADGDVLGVGVEVPAGVVAVLVPVGINPACSRMSCGAFEPLSRLA